MILAVELTVSGAIAIGWVAVVPIFQSPDENIHFDYAISIYSAGRLINARELPVTDAATPMGVNPYTRLLEDRTAIDVVAHHSQVKMPTGYGSPLYLRQINADATRISPEQTLNPLLVSVYPFGYYALIAAVMGVVHAEGGGLVEMFYAARMVSVVLFVAGLALTYALVRELGSTRERALVITGIVGIFPLSSFVASYIQPDNLAFTLVTASLYAAARWRRRAPTLRSTAGLGLLLALLLVTKYQFYFCVAAAVVPMLALRRQTVSRWASLIAPSVLLGAVQAWVAYGGSRQILIFTHPTGAYTQWSIGEFAAAASQGIPALAGFVTVEVAKGFLDLYLLGTTSLTFWGKFGWVDTPLTIGPPPTTLVIRFLIACATVSVLIAVVVHFSQAGRRLWRVGRRRGVRAAATIALNNPAATAYFAFTALFYATYVVSGDTFGAQGRNWFPLLPAILIVASTVAPKALARRRLRDAMSNAVLVGFGAYAVVGAVASFGVLTDRFYGAGRELVAAADPSTMPVASEPAAYQLDYVLGPYSVQESTPQHVPAGGHLAIGGRAPAAKTVFVTIDGIFSYEAVYGDGEARSGFDVIVPTSTLRPGPHTFVVDVVAPDSRSFARSAPIAFIVD